MADGNAAAGGTPFMERHDRTPTAAVGHRPIERAITESSTAARRVLLAAIVVLALAGIGPGTAQEPSAPLYALFRAAQTDDAELAAFALDKGANIEALGFMPLLCGTRQGRRRFPAFRERPYAWDLIIFPSASFPVQSQPCSGSQPIEGQLPFFDPG